MLLSFPQLIMGLMLVAVLGPSIGNLILAIAVTAVAGLHPHRAGLDARHAPARLRRCLSGLGLFDIRIMFGHILPNIMDEVVVLASLWLATAIRTESTLAFIGLGVPPPTATWGSIVREGFDNLLDAPWLSIFPSLAILAVMIGLNLIGDGLRDATDPRGRHENPFDDPRRTVQGRRSDDPIRVGWTWYDAVREVSFSVSGGETLALVGESGCGKSLTALSVMGAARPKVGRVASGSIVVDGTDMRAASESQREAMRGDRLAMIFQEPMTSLNRS